MRRTEFTQKTKPGDASKLVVGIAVSHFNEDITEQLLLGARDMLKKWNVKDENIRIARVAGSFELPYAALRLIKKQKVNAVVALGCIIKGDTKHDEYLAAAVFNGLMHITFTERIAVGLGVLTTNDLAQARARAEGTTNHGAHAAAAALQAALLK